MSLRKLNVLVVDDNASDRVVARAILTKAGMRSVQEAEDGSIAEKKIRTALEIGKPFELIILDWKMPRENGLSILKMIRSDFKLKGTKVLMVTGLADPKLVTEAKKLNVDGFLVKPLTFESLDDKIQRLFKADG